MAMQIKDKFPEVLRKKLLKKYGYIPSCTVFANHFNLKSSGYKTITRETARRWINGDSFPQLDNFYTLTSWLKFTEEDLNIIFDIETNKILRRIEDSENFKLISIYESLFDNHKEILILIASALRQKQDNAV
jgi:hypothetical protein